MNLSLFPVCIAEEPGKGRCLLATQAIAREQVVLISHAWLSCLCPSQASSCCARCLRRRPLHAACQGRCRTRYCSDACRDADQTDHCLECDAIPLLEARLRSAGDVVWHNGDALLNALLLARAARYLASAPANDAAANMATPFKARPNALRAMLTSPRLSIPLTIAEATLAVAAQKKGFLPPYLPTTGKRLVDKSGARDDSDGVEWLVRLLLQQQVNACGVLDLERFEVTGEGLFVEGALVNHSCSPTCQFMYRWNGPGQRPTQYLLAIRDISPGEELTIAYRDTEQPVWERRSRLQRSHWFTCRCARCRADVQLSGLGAQGRYVADADGRILRCLVEATVQSAQEAAAALRGLQAAGLSIAPDVENQQVEAARAIAAGPYSSNINAFRLETETMSPGAKEKAKRSLKCTLAALRELESVLHAEARILIDLRTLAVAQAEACGDAECLVNQTAALIDGVGVAYGDLHPRRLSLLALRHDALVCLGSARVAEASAALAELRSLRARLGVDFEGHDEVVAKETASAKIYKRESSRQCALQELD